MFRPYRLNLTATEKIKEEHASLREEIKKELKESEGMFLNSKTGEQLSIELDEVIVTRGDTARLSVILKKELKLTNYLQERITKIKLW